MPRQGRAKRLNFLWPISTRIPERKTLFRLDAAAQASFDPPISLDRPLNGLAVDADGATVYATLKPAPGSLPRGQRPETLVETVPELPMLVSITVT